MSEGRWQYADVADHVGELRAAGQHDEALRLAIGALSRALRRREPQWEARFQRICAELQRTLGHTGPSCAFCPGEPSTEKLVAGPNVHICAACVGTLGKARQGRVLPAHLAFVTSQQPSTLACSFCGDGLDIWPELMVSATAAICPSCTGTAHDIVEEKWGVVEQGVEADEA